ncbi:uncharacterized protein LAESUDRAFT_667350 [Laetiporus sulphureus 93-53]|uniref:Metallo-beta-lactamase domain-containing protein n=1 Tax=Laetiporus sulphureus 93-53 TaxID=1314785 RepID=A0A165AYU9_9APHY|nr:uncharacterized protein LAESUDRAFT_667350 [Laetiporus sulphureus 93-53]KZS99913.1 hypothetical protein LAESUDRAFT_667350 [Laetiporus sulphureus 93-53]
MAATLPPPGSYQAYIEVSALEAGIIHLPLQLFVAGSDPSEIRTCPSLAFSLRHSITREHLVFDLGIRRNTESYPPIVRGAIAKWMPVTVPQSVDESLKSGGIPPQEVSTIILSHLHFDHVGDPSAFPNATFIIGEGGEGLMKGGFPANPQSDVLQDTVPIDRTRSLTAENFSTSVGPFPRAFDYFGDGSLFLIDAVGHCAGHINVLARTSSAGSWIYLAADTAHDVGLLTGEKSIAFTIDPSGRLQCAHANKDEAEEHIRRVGQLLKLPHVHVLLAHDWEWYEKNKGGEAFLPGIISPLM